VLHLTTTVGTMAAGCVGAGEYEGGQNEEAAD